MKEQLYNQIITCVSDFVSIDAMKELSKKLSIILNNYDVEKSSREMIVYNGIPECVRNYLVTRKIEGVKLSSLKQYNLRLTQFFKMVQIPMDKITANDVRIWLFNLQNNSVGKNGKHMSDRTLDGARNIICTFFKWATAEGYIKDNPCANIKKIKWSAKEREALSEEELELVRENCKSARDKALVETLYSTGCRVSELVNIKISDVDFKGGGVK